LVFRIFDLFMLDGFNVIFQLALAILQLNHDFLLRQGFENILAFLTRNGVRDKYETDFEELLSAALSIKISARQMKAFEKAYQAKKAKEIGEAGDILRMQVDHERLTQQAQAMAEKVRRGAPYVSFFDILSFCLPEFRSSAWRRRTLRWQTS
jgi:hypothetical protein